MLVEEVRKNTSAIVLTIEIFYFAYEIAIPNIVQVPINTFKLKLLIFFGIGLKRTRKSTMKIKIKS